MPGEFAKFAHFMSLVNLRGALSICLQIGIKPKANRLCPVYIYRAVFSSASVDFFTSFEGTKIKFQNVSVQVHHYTNAVCSIDN